jgi:outer membrane protein OmpA-like peptidoglycan-associated protein
MMFQRLQRAVAPPVVHDVLRCAGKPLDAETQQTMSTRFGQDFSQVRVHSDPQAAESARAIGARAYTVGPNIVFGAGRYQPGSPAGRQLLAHELTHVRQQRTGAIPMPGHLLVAAADTAAEHEASAAHHGPAAASHTAAVCVQRQTEQGESVIFSTNSSQVFPEILSVVAEFVSFYQQRLQGNKQFGQGVIVEGHAGQGETAGLARARADAVKAELVNRGIPATAITITIPTGPAGSIGLSSPAMDQRVLIRPADPHIMRGNVTSPATGPFAGLGARKQALKSAHGTPQDLAIAMLETEHMDPREYPFGDVDPSAGPGKTTTGDAACFGIFRQNWHDIRLSGKLPPNPTGKPWTAADWRSGGSLINANLSLDVEVLHASKARLGGADQWFANHRWGTSGHAAFLHAASASVGTRELAMLASIADYRSAVRWIEDELGKLPDPWQGDDKFWVHVPNV